MMSSDPVGECSSLKVVGRYCIGVGSGSSFFLFGSRSSVGDIRFGSDVLDMVGWVRDWIVDKCFTPWHSCCPDDVAKHLEKSGESEGREVENDDQELMNCSLDWHSRKSEPARLSGMVTSLI